MKLAELNDGQGSVNVEVEVVSVEEPRTFNKYGRDIKVANAVIKDDSGELQLTLWNDDIAKVKPGMKLKIENGYVKEFNGVKQLTTGKFGKFEILGEGGGASEEPKEEAPAESEGSSEGDAVI